MIINNPPKPLLERRTAKIDEQPDGLLGKFQISQQLFGMCSIKPFH